MVRHLLGMSRGFVSVGCAIWWGVVPGLVGMVRGLVGAVGGLFRVVRVIRPEYNYAIS
jgi:hypothetical protein